jgi:hypothetical protein
VREAERKFTESRQLDEPPVGSASASRDGGGRRAQYAACLPIAQPPTETAAVGGDRDPDAGGSRRRSPRCARRRARGNLRLPAADCELRREPVEKTYTSGEFVRGGPGIKISHTHRITSIDLTTDQ